MSLVLETMMVDIGSDGKIGEIEYQVEEWAMASDDHHTRHFPYSSSPGGKFGESPPAMMMESEWFEASTHNNQHSHDTEEPLIDSWGLPSETFADLETFEFLMPAEAETETALAKVLQEQIDAGLERLALTSPKANKKKRPSPMKDTGSSKKRQKTNEKAAPAATAHTEAPSPPTPGQRVQPPRQIKRESYDEDGDAIMSTPTKKLSFSETFRATANASAPLSGSSSSTSSAATLDWSEAEIVSFEEGLVLFGRPQWKHISQHVKSRNVHQIKAFAKQYFAERGKDYVPPITEERLQYLVDQFHKNKPQKQKPGRKPKKTQDQPAQPQASQQQQRSQTASSSSSASSSPAQVAAPQPTPKRGKTVAPDGTIVSRRVGSSGEVIVLNAEEEDEEEIVDIDVDSEHASIDDDVLDGPDVDDDDEDEDINLLINDQDDDDESNLEAEYAASQANYDEGDMMDEDSDDMDSSSSEGVYFAINADPSHPRAVIISTKREPSSTSSSSSSKKLKVTFKKEEDNNEFPPMAPLDFGVSGFDMTAPDDSVGHSTIVSAAAAATNQFFSQEWLEDIHIPPQAPMEIHDDEIRDIEIRANAEFFEGNSVKTPERYLRIRNHIVRASPPNRDRYVTKTSVRRGLRDCGDVNAIGRIHQFLELIGALNFNMEAPANCRKQGQETAAGAVAEAVSRMSHGKRIGLGPSNMLSKFQMPASFAAFDCRLNLNAPDLYVDCSASMVMDVHSHLSREISVGLLLGCLDAEKAQLRVLHAVPCLLSNVINSDMASPSSPHQQSPQHLTKSEWVESVRAYAAKLQLDVVGMYQTRPDSNTAVTMDNYLHFKHTYRKAGHSYHYPFIAIFGCSHGLAAEGLHGAPAALTQWHHVALDDATEKKMSSSREKPLLHVFRRNVIGTRRLPLEQIAQLFNAYRGADNGVDLSELWSVDVSKTLLDKLFASLSSAIYVSEKEKNQFWEQLRSLSADGVSGRLLTRVQTSTPVWLPKDPSVVGSVLVAPPRSNSVVASPARSPVPVSKQPKHSASAATSANNTLANFDIHIHSTSSYPSSNRH